MDELGKGLYLPSLSVRSHFKEVRKEWMEASGSSAT